MQQDDIAAETRPGHFVLAPDHPVINTVRRRTGLPVQRIDGFTDVQVVLLSGDGHRDQLFPFLRLEIRIVRGPEHDRGMPRDAFDEQPGGFHFQDGPSLADFSDIRMGEGMVADLVAFFKFAFD